MSKEIKPEDIKWKTVAISPNVFVHLGELKDEEGTLITWMPQLMTMTTDAVDEAIEAMLTLREQLGEVK